MIFVTNALGKATYIGDEWTALTGQRLEDAVDYGWSRVVHPDDVARVRSIVARAIAARCEFSIAYRVLQPNGEAAWVSAGAVPSFGPPDRTFLGFLGSITVLAAPPAEGTDGALGRFNPPDLPPDSEPRSTLEQVADHLIRRMRSSCRWRHLCARAGQGGVARGRAGPRQAARGGAERADPPLSARLGRDARPGLRSRGGVGVEVRPRVSCIISAATVPRTLKATR